MHKHKASDYTIHNSVQIIRGGADYFSQIETIASNATYSLHLQTYIFEADETGQKVANALIAAATRGIHVYVILDGYASQALTAQFVDRLEHAGVHFRFFEPLMRSRHFYFGRRLHHKVIVADGRVCLIGGVNISNRYNDLPSQPAWLDWALLVEGDAAAQVDKICRRMWDRSLTKEKCKATSPPRLNEPNNKCLVRVRRNDWVYKKTQISTSYHQAFATAKSHITVMTSYFWPPASMLNKIRAATKRGVTVKIVLTGNADVPMVKYAERYLYPFLLRHKVEVYEYTRNVLHGKIAARDNEWATVGSYNVNNISAFASVELNLDVLDIGIATQLNEAIQKIIDEDCKRITHDNYQASANLLKRFVYYLSYHTVHTVLFFLFTFYFTQRRRNS